MWKVSQRPPMAQWNRRARQRLRDGESIEASVSVGDNGVVVTNQRLLAFAPETEGQNYRAVERPNIEHVSVETIGNEEWLPHVGKAALFGIVGVALGLTVDFGSLLSLEGVDTSGADDVGVGGMLSILRTIADLLAMLDDVFLVGGLLAVAVGLGAFGLYVESRQEMLVVSVAGGNDVQVPVAEGADDGVDSIKAALFEPDVDGDRTVEQDPLAPQFESGGD